MVAECWEQRSFTEILVAPHLALYSILGKGGEEMEVLVKAIRVHQFGAPEVMKLEELPGPVPGPGQAVVKIGAVGVNPVETYIRSGAYARKPALPFTPGSDAAGVIESIGEGVDRFRVGDRVFLGGSVSGTYAEEALCNLNQIHLLPERISLAQGAAVHTPYSAAYRALFNRARAIPGEWFWFMGLPVEWGSLRSNWRVPME